MKESQTTDQSNRLETLLSSFSLLSQRYVSDVPKALQLVAQARKLFKDLTFEDTFNEEQLSELSTCIGDGKSLIEYSLQTANGMNELAAMLEDIVKADGQQNIEMPSQSAKLFDTEHIKQIKQLGNGLMKESSLIFAELDLFAGKSLVKAGNWYRGLDVLRKAYEQFRVFEDMDGMARSLIEIGTVQELFGDYEIARLSFLDAERLFKKAKREEGIAVAELQLGTLALDHYDYEQARPHLQFASNFFHQHGDQERAKLSDDFLKLADEFERDLALV